MGRPTSHVSTPPPSSPRLPPMGTFRNPSTPSRASGVPSIPMADTKSPSSNLSPKPVAGLSLLAAASANVPRAPSAHARVNLPGLQELGLATPSSLPMGQAYGHASQSQALGGVPVFTSVPISGLTGPRLQSVPRLASVAVNIPATPSRPTTALPNPLTWTSPILSVQDTPTPSHGQTTAVNANAAPSHTTSAHLVHTIASSAGSTSQSTTTTLPITTSTTQFVQHALPTTTNAVNYPGFGTVFIHTAKCDVCSAHNTSILHRCNTCAWQVCDSCMVSRKDGGDHECIGKMVFVPPGTENMAAGLVGNADVLAMGNARPIPLQGPPRKPAKPRGGGRGRGAGRGRGRGGRGGNAGGAGGRKDKDDDDKKDKKGKGKATPDDKGDDTEETSSSDSSDDDEPPVRKNKRKAADTPDAPRAKRKYVRKAKPAPAVVDDEDEDVVDPDTPVPSVEADASAMFPGLVGTIAVDPEVIVTVSEDEEDAAGRKESGSEGSVSQEDGQDENGDPEGSEGSGSKKADSDGSGSKQDNEEDSDNSNSKESGQEEKDDSETSGPKENNEEDSDNSNSGSNSKKTSSEEEEEAKSSEEELTSSQEAALERAFIAGVRGADPGPRPHPYINPVERMRREDPEFYDTWTNPVVPAARSAAAADAAPRTLYGRAGARASGRINTGRTAAGKALPGTAARNARAAVAAAAAAGNSDKKGKGKGKEPQGQGN